ncbi:MAG: hypothetical protein LBG22_10440 [Treponema sp.]|nr:hypothetical protein [Treponema sp.]
MRYSISARAPASAAALVLGSRKTANSREGGKSPSVASPGILPAEGQKRDKG